MDNNTGSTIRTIKFYSIEGMFKEWYADLPEYIEQGGEIADLQMVGGADVLLDTLSDHGDLIEVRFSELPFEGCDQLDLIESDDEDFQCPSGAFYYIDTIGEKLYDDHIWLCDVLKWVFGKFPLTIYYKPISDPTN